MKVLSIIFVIHILFLTIAPALSMTPGSFEQKQCKKKSCCNTNKETKNSTQKKDCCSSCNAFMACCNGYALNSEPQNIFAPFVYSNQGFIIITENNDSDFLSDAWNPPKAA